jgi:hypothetical protein
MSELPIVFDDPLDAMIEQGRLAGMYRPFFRRAAWDFRARFGDIGMAGTFLGGLGGAFRGSGSPPSPIQGGGSTFFSPF